MKQEDQLYIASIRKYDYYNNSFSIMKDVTKILKNNPNLNVEGLIDYLLEDDEFSEDEKEIKNQLDELIRIGRKGYEFVEIKFRNNKGEDKFIEAYYNKDMLRTRGVSNTPMIKEEIKKAKHYFKDKTFDGINYKGLSLEVEMRHID